MSPIHIIWNMQPSIIESAVAAAVVWAIVLVQLYRRLALSKGKKEE
jgi:DMSO/TMAO reductase YedYZ heme-binding membrane subunit